MLSFFPRDVLDEILNLIESVSEGFPSYSCAILERNYGSEPSSQTIALSYLKLDTVPSVWPFILIFLRMALVLFVISLFFSTLVSNL